MAANHKNEKLESNGVKPLVIVLQLSQCELAELDGLIIYEENTFLDVLVVENFFTVHEDIAALCLVYTAQEPQYGGFACTV